MRRKSIFTVFAAVFMVLAFSTMALAANQVFVKTTVPNIPKSTCYQAGTDTFELDDASTIAEGDAITITLNNNVTVCKAIDMFVTIATQPGVLDATGTLPVSTTGGSVNAAAAASQWGFLVQAPLGSQIITLTLRQVTTVGGALNALTPANRMTYAATAPTDKLVIKLFDDKIGVFATSGIQKRTAAGVYNTALVAGDNTLCIDTLTQNFLGEYVVNTPNSVPGLPGDILNFSGDYTIAHIMAAQTFNLVTCKGATCGHIVLGASGQASTCVAFDYETLGTGLNGYCTDHTATTGVPKFIIQTSQAFDAVPYTVTAEILVNGVAGEHGVYWSNVAPLYDNSPTSQCGAAVAAKALGAASYLRGDGLTPAAPVGPIAASCAGVAAGAKAVKWTTAAAPLFTAGTDFFFELNLPAFNYNLAEVNAGDVVTVRVTLAKATCGSVTMDLCIGTFGCAAAAATTSSILCPYVTSIAGADAFWNGLALTNTATQPVTVAITAYKADGTTATATQAVPAQGTVATLVSDFAWTGTAPVGVPAYISATASGATTIPATSLQGFVMMADGANNSMGYLCK